MTTADLTDRLRDLLRDRAPREVRMFGGTSFMVDERMVAAARGNGELLLRIDPQQSALLRGRPGARQATMGTGRTMGPGWLAVDAAALTDSELQEWLQHALDFHAAQG